MSKEKKGKILFYGQTDMGRQRTNNEDAFVAEKLDENTILAVAIDGVGGYEGGEVAAAIAQKEIPAYIKKYSRGERLELLKQAVVSANNAIVEQRQVDTERANMSCVLTAALIDKERKVVDMVHVGDTRLYQFHQGQLRKLSHDHSLVGYREEIGDLTEEQAMHHPQRNVISRDVGSAQHEVEDRDFLESEEFPLLPNSIFLFCSDGLTDLITAKQIVGVLELPDSLEAKTQMLIDMANEAGGKDNITVVLVEYQAEEVPASVEKNVVSPIEKDVEESASEVTVKNASEKTKTGKKARNKTLLVLYVIITLLLATCVALLLWARTEHNKVQKMQDSQISSCDTVTNNLVDTPIVSYVPENVVKYIIQLYSWANEKNDFETISQLYADNVRRYCKKNNVSNEDVVKCYKNYDSTFEIKGKRSQVRWNTLEVKCLPNGEMTVAYTEDFSLERKDTNSTKPSSYVLRKNMVLDANVKIVSLYDSIISSKPNPRRGNGI